MGIGLGNKDVTAPSCPSNMASFCTLQWWWHTELS